MCQEGNSEEVGEKIQLRIISEEHINLESNAPHSRYMEYGTIFITPRPYMRTALDITRAIHLPIIIQETKSKYN